MDREVYYKLRDKKTGKFKCKGMWGKWTKTGDVWANPGHIKLHLNQIPADKVDFENWEIVEYRFEPKEAGAKLLKDLL